MSDYWTSHAAAAIGLALVLVLVAASAGVERARAGEVVELGALADSLVAALPALVEAAFVESGLPSLSVAVVHDRDIIYSQAFGYADLEGRVPATTATVYPIASVTKTFVATMLVKLAEDGVLSLDTPVSTLVPEYKVASPFNGTQPTTLRQLATHTSGLPRDANINFWSDYSGLKWFMSEGATEMRWYASTEEVLSSLEEMRLVYPPYSRYLYSNLGMTVLGVALERAANAPFEDYVRSQILEPLGMTHSGFRHDFSDSSALARGYVRLEPRADPIRAPEWDLRSAQFSGGLYSTAEDMARFLSLQFQDDPVGGAQIISADGLRMMHLESIAWGYVWDAAHKGIEHTGGHLGFHAFVRAYPSLKIGVAALTNSNDPLDGEHPSDEIARAVLSYLKGIVEDRSGPGDAMATALQDYAGTYSLPGAQAELALEMIEGGLRVRLLQDADFDYPMVLVGPDRFGTEDDADTWLEFHRNGVGDVRSVDFAGFRFDRTNSPRTERPPD